MKNLKTFAVALAIMITGNTFASKEKPAPDKKSNSYELARLLEDQSLALQKDFIGKAIFSVNEEKEIVLHAVLGKEEFVKDYIIEKLSDQVLSGDNWVVGKVYSLPVKMKMRK